VDVEIRPEPTPEEREALLAVLARLNGKAREASAWWEAGIRESVEEPEESQEGLAKRGLCRRAALDAELRRPQSPR
jgi:hypothetical protein